MTKEFIPYKQALALKELGFDEPCFAHFVKHDDEIKCILDSDDFDEWWTNNSDNLQVKAPLYQQTFRWFREKYKLFGCIDLHTSTPTHWYIRVDDIIKNDYLFHSEDDNLEFNTYEEAELACLIKLIEIVKNK
jgi:hypothetical protein